MRLTRKLFLIVVSLALLAVISLAVIIFSATKSGIENGLKERQYLRAVNNMEDVDRYFYQGLQNVRAIADEKIFEDNIESGEDFDLMQHRVGELLVHTGPWELLQVINEEGEIVVSSKEAESGENVEDSYGAVIGKLMSKVAGDGYAYSDIVQVSGVDDVTLVVMAAMKEDESGEMIGTVVGYLDLEGFLEILSREKEGEVHLMNSRGLEIGENGNEHEIGDISFENYAEKQAWKMIAAKDIGSFVISDLHTGEQALTSKVIQQGYLDYEGSGWVYLIQTPYYETVIAVSVMAAGYVVIPLMVIVSMIIGSVLYVMKKNLVDPVNTLKDMASKVAGGDLLQRVDINSKDEIGELAKSLNHMVSKMKMSQDELKKKVKTRTEKLQESKVDLEKEIAARTKELSEAKENLEAQVTERTLELERRLGQVEAFNKAAVGREKKMILLKSKIVRLEREIKRFKKEIADESVGESDREDTKKDA